MTPKLRKAIEAALDAADEIVREIENPTMNLRDNWEFVKGQYKAIKAARRALEKEGTP